MLLFTTMACVLWDRARQQGLVECIPAAFDVRPSGCYETYLTERTVSKLQDKSPISLYGEEKVVSRFADWEDEISTLENEEGAISQLGGSRFRYRQISCSLSWLSMEPWGSPRDVVDEDVGPQPWEIWLIEQLDTLDGATW